MADPDWSRADRGIARVQGPIVAWETRLFDFVAFPRYDDERGGEGFQPQPKITSPLWPGHAEFVQTEQSRRQTQSKVAGHDTRSPDIHGRRGDAALGRRTDSSGDCGASGE